MDNTSSPAISGSTSSPEDRDKEDNDFDPTAEQLVDAFDDERTLDEEEAQQDEKAVQDELSDLQKESEMPLHELLAMYGSNAAAASSESDSERQSQDGGSDSATDARSAAASTEPSAAPSHEAMSPVADKAASAESAAGEPASATAATTATTMDIPSSVTDLLDTSAAVSGQLGAHPASVSTTATTTTTASKSVDLGELPPAPPVDAPKVEDVPAAATEPVAEATLPGGAIGGTTAVPAAAVGAVTNGLTDMKPPTARMDSDSELSDSDAEEGHESEDGDSWRKQIQVGSSYQAEIPQLCAYDDAPVYENEDRLLWDPSVLIETEVSKYLESTQKQTYEEFARGESHSLNAVYGAHIRDDEEALYLLLQCGHNVDEALRRRKIKHVPAYSRELVSLWSEEETKLFEEGLLEFGKNFHEIQKMKVRTRTIGELVLFYYLWKKTERHDEFINRQIKLQQKTEKKICSTSWNNRLHGPLHQRARPGGGDHRGPASLLARTATFARRERPRQLSSFGQRYATSGIAIFHISWSNWVANQRSDFLVIANHWVLPA